MKKDLWKISPSSLSGTIKIPPSKSQTMRALQFGLLAKGKTTIYNVLKSPDVLAMIKACQSLGAQVDLVNDRIEMEGLNGKIEGSDNIIDCGNSGLVFRFIGALGALSKFPLVLTGDESIRNNREIKPLLDALSQLGAKAFSLRKGGGAPIYVQGPIQSTMATMSGEDSQPVSGLLIAASFAPSPIEIFVVNPGEKPWVDLTLSWFNRFGISYVAQNYEYYSLKGNAHLDGFTYVVPGDHSSSLFPIVAALITNSEIKIQNLDFHDPQGDQKLISILQEMGAKIEIDQITNTLYIKKNSHLNGMTIDANDFIDACPILAVMGCFAEGETRVTGAAIARKKECDRLACIVKELQKMGASILEKEDGFIVRPSSLKGNTVESHSDHRVAMALAVAGLGAQGETVISGPSCIRKSYPNFLKEFCSLGAEIQLLS